MNRINYPTPLLLIIAVSLFIALLMGVGFLWPRQQSANILNTSIKQKMQTIQYEEAYTLKLNELKSKIEDYEESLAKIASTLPDDSSMPSLLNFLQKATSQSGMILTSISPFPSSSLAGSKEIKETILNVRILGPYNSFKNFLSTLENSARLIEVNGIYFSTPKEGVNFDFSVDLKVYSY